MRFSKVQSLRVQGCYAVGWSDLHFFAIVENRHTARSHGTVCIFSFSKNHRDLKNDFFFQSLQKPSFYIKEQLSKRKFKIRICLVFLFLFFKNGKNSFLPKKMEFLFIFSY